MSAEDDGRPVVLLVDDDAAIRRSVAEGLELEGFRVVPASGGRAALAALDSMSPAVVVLDLSMPDLDGLEVLERLRAGGDDVPVCVLSARDEVEDRVRGLEAGADDYVVKPAQPTVLDARIRAVLRRGTGPPDGVRVHRDLHIDTTSLTVSLRGVPVMLTPTELRLLLTLSRAPGRVFTRQQLLEEVWEHDYLGDSRLVDNGVQRLRAKIEINPASPEFVQTVRGFGYRFGPG